MHERNLYIMKATGIVRRIDDLGRVVIPKEIRRTMRIREGDPPQTALTRTEKYCRAMLEIGKRVGIGEVDSIPHHHPAKSPQHQY